MFEACPVRHGHWRPRSLYARGAFTILALTEQRWHCEGRSKQPCEKRAYDPLLPSKRLSNHFCSRASSWRQAGRLPVGAALADQNKGRPVGWVRRPWPLRVAH